MGEIMFHNAKCYDTFMADTAFDNVKCYHTFIGDMVFHNIKCHPTLLDDTALAMHTRFRVANVNVKRFPKLMAHV